MVQVPHVHQAETQTLTTPENHSSFLEVCRVLQRQSPKSRERAQQPLTNRPHSSQHLTLLVSLAKPQRKAWCWPHTAQD